jgi:hypothetical protein
MPTLSIGNDIVFHYTDSGPIEQAEYSTLVFVHGLSFHTGILCLSLRVRVTYIHDRQVYASESYLSLAPIHCVLSVLAAANTKDPLPTPQMS